MKITGHFSRRACLARLACVTAFGLGLGLPAAAGSFDDFFRALHRDDAQALQGLALRGFDMNTRDESGQPPLLVAIRAEAVRAAEFLARQPQMDLDALNANGENALMLAALSGYQDLMRLLVEQGAEVNKPGWTPLHYAATYSGPASAEMVEFLLDQNAYIDAESPNGTTPLMMAARYGENRVVRLLLDAGADPMLRNERGLTALDFASAAERRDNAELIAKAMRALSSTGSW